MAFTDETARALTARALIAQTDGRVPGLAAGVARKGRLEWFRGIGTIDLDSPGDAPDEDTQYAVASNSKTFTAVAIMALRDEGRLDLDDTVEQHLSDSSHAGVTIRQLLSHTSGMQREQVGDVFDTLGMPSREELLAGWSTAERVGRPHDRWHYSNLGYAVLGEIIARLDGRPWEDAIRRRILDPLEMGRTGTTSSGRRAKGYYVPPFAVYLTEDAGNPNGLLYRWTPPAACARPRPTSPAGAGSSPIRSRRSSPPTRSRRCASHRSWPTPSAGSSPGAWGSSSSGTRAAPGSATPAAGPARSPASSPSGTRPPRD